MDDNSFVNQLYHKAKIFARKERHSFQKEKGDFNFAFERRSATSLSKGREFLPLRLIW